MEAASDFAPRPPYPSDPLPSPSFDVRLGERNGRLMAALIARLAFVTELPVALISGLAFVAELSRRLRWSDSLFELFDL